MKLGSTMSSEQREKIRAKAIGRRRSPEMLAIMRAKRVGRTLSESHKRNIGLAALGNKGPVGNQNRKGAIISEETRAKMRESHLGKTLPVEQRLKIAAAMKGEKSHLWKGGITAQSKLIRSSVEYKLWRESVFKRDDFACVFCGKRGVELHADHIKPFALFPELRFAIDNGRTLCVPCHETTDTYLWKMQSFKQSTNN